jgi:hypothetical protein
LRPAHLVQNDPLLMKQSAPIKFESGLIIMSIWAGHEQLCSEKVKKTKNSNFVTVHRHEEWFDFDKSCCARLINLLHGNHNNIYEDKVHYC